MLVDGVTKLDKVTYGDAAQAETVRKMVVAMARDIRVLVIKLADRLHNARTWRYVSPASRPQRKARETLEIYAPLAHRLGMNTIKWELEDLSFATLYPKVYDEIVRLVADRAPAREEYLAGVREAVKSDLAAARIKATVTGRPKHYYSVYQKMIVRGRDFEEIYDLVAVRVLVDSVRDCYAVLGALHARWNPVPGRFKDYIAMPKFNMYQSLHTTVIGPEGKPVEIQIRTHTMHRRAEYGVAAHWKYKENGSAGAEAGAGRDGDGPVNDMAWLRQLLDWQRETSDPGEFLDSLRFEINAREVYVFTPKGSVIALPAGVDPGRLRLRRAHRGRAPLHRRAGQRPARAAGEHAGERRRRRGAHLQGRRRRAVARLADVRQEPAGPQQDPPVVLQGAPRGGDRLRQGRDRQGDAQAGPAAAAPDDPRDADQPGRRAALRRHLRALRRGGRGARVRPARRGPAGRVDGRRGGRQRGPRRGDQPHPGDAPPQRRPGRRGRRHRRRVGQAGALLHAGAGRPDHRLRHPRQRRLGAPRRLHQRRVAAAASPTG